MNSVPKIGGNDKLKNKRTLRPGAPTRRGFSTSPTPNKMGIQKRWERPNLRSHSLSPSLVYTRQCLQNMQPLESLQTEKPSTSSMEEENMIASKLAELSAANDSTKITIPQLAVIKMNRLLISKKRDFMKLRNQVITQQNILIEQLTALKEMETKAGLTPDETLGDVTVLALKPWPAHDLVLLIKDVMDLALPSDTVSYFGAKVLQKMNTKLLSLPDQVKKLCSQLIESRNDFLNFVHPKCKSDRNTFQSTIEWKAIKARNEQDTEKLQALTEETCGKIKRVIEKSLKLAMLPWLDRDILTKNLEKIQKENTVLQTKLTEAMKPPENGSSVTHEKEYAEQQEVINSLNEELSKERSARETLKEAVAAAEGMLRAARARVLTLEKQMKDLRSELDLTKRKLKDMELFHRQRETSHDARSKKLIEVSRTGETTIETLLKQRDALEQRVKELHEQADMTEKDVEKRLGQEKSKQERLMYKAAEQDKECNALRTTCEGLEARVKELQSDLEKMREYSSKLVEIGKVKCLDYIPVKEKDPTLQDTNLWIELQQTRESLGRKDEELKQIREDKERFLQSLYNIAKGGEEEKEDKMAAALVEKEKVIAKMQKTIRDLQENQESTAKLKKLFTDKITELRMENYRLNHYECYSKEIPYQDLQTELLDMYMRVETHARERSALVSAAASRSLMLERHERAVELFARMTRARQELSAYLNERAQSPAAEPSLNMTEISRSLSSLCANAADTWNALRAERLRSFRLESAVLSQDQQLEREARLRTQMQDRRAALERELVRCHALLEGNNDLHMPSRR